MNRNYLEPESEPGTRHRVARWRTLDGATLSDHPLSSVQNLKEEYLTSCRKNTQGHS